MSPSLKIVTALLYICIRVVGDNLITPNFEWCFIANKLTLQRCQKAESVLGKAGVVLREDRYMIYSSNTTERYAYITCLNDAIPLQKRLLLFSPYAKFDQNQIVILFSDMLKKGPGWTYVFMNLFRDEDAPTNVPVWEDFLMFGVKVGRLIVGIAMGDKGPEAKPYSQDFVQLLRDFLTHPYMKNMKLGLQLDAVRMSHTFDIMSTLIDFNPIIIVQHPNSEDWFVNIPQLYSHLKRIKEKERYLFLSNAVYHQLATNPLISIPYPEVPTTTTEKPTQKHSNNNGRSRLEPFCLRALSFNGFVGVQLYWTGLLMVH